jgi:hypothetical protein
MKTISPNAFKKDIDGSWVNLNLLNVIKIQKLKDKFAIIGVKDQTYWIFDQSDDEELLKMNLKDFLFTK